ncbi:tRNA (adenosine(37)-N6)-dimethylallyltransferase MiaA [Labrys wisconsinensis]|uniref:tRNA dimethylallyltransferase n=1 Tax=Labrys wisconsinensis TaxID=425677 RepID=A0ABU0JB32_9HYPH|nr:tRNA (adenosine(37)-N6)-dimethylallyltransferase MiaA [Labrys wisconsinensis]MDQ0471469.1 tRNA dimethylallyltransferase [Labrys wisconsinensis]
MSADRIDAVLLAGPTASGKSALALALAERFGGEIVNADSMQVYADLAVLTARPGPSETARAPHLLYGHVDGAINYSVGRWYAQAGAAIEAVRRRGRLPIVVGGTGLYFKALERGLAEMPAVPEAVREAVRADAEDEETPALHGRLAQVDPDSAARLRPSDRQRILRALEVYAATGRPLSLWQGQPHSQPLVEAACCLRLFLAPERAALYAGIDARFGTMLAAGALTEVARLAARGLDPALPVMRAHGVPWLIRHLGGAVDLEAAAAGAKADTRHYAKRQFTWFRHQMPGWTFLPPSEAPAAAAAALARGR